MKKLSLYEKIDRVCRLGKHAILESINGNYTIVSPIKDFDGNWRRSRHESNIGSTSKEIGSEDGSTPRDWDLREQEGYKYIGVWTPPAYERFRVGDKVKVMATGINLIVHNVNTYTYKLRESYGSILAVLFYHDELEPVLDEEEETVEVFGKKYKKNELVELLKELKEVEA